MTRSPYFLSIPCRRLLTSDGQVSWNKREILLFANSIGVKPNELHLLYELRKPSYSFFKM
jgi:hypothetical protein